MIQSFLMKNIKLSRDLGRTLGWSYVNVSLYITFFVNIRLRDVGHVPPWR